MDKCYDLRFQKKLETPAFPNIFNRKINFSWMPAPSTTRLLGVFTICGPVTRLPELLTSWNVLLNLLNTWNDLPQLLPT